MVISFVKVTPVCFDSLLKLIFRQPENHDRFASTCFLFFFKLTKGIFEGTPSLTKYLGKGSASKISRGVISGSLALQNTKRAPFASPQTIAFCHSPASICTVTFSLTGIMLSSSRHLGQANTETTTAVCLWSPYQGWELFY